MSERSQHVRDAAPAPVPAVLHQGPPQDPPSGLPYPLVLRPTSMLQGMVGLVAAFTGFVLFVPIVSAFVIQVGAWIRRPDDWGVYQKAARAYELPEGLLAGHLGLAFLTIIALVIARFFHGRSAKWTFSVQPGMRWRYLLVTFLAAAVLLNGMLWLGFTWQGMPEFHGGQEAWPLFLAVVLISSPLQALAEEVFFRGYLLQVMGSMVGKVWFGIVFSSLIFAILHGTQNPALFVHRLAFGLVSGWLVLKTGGLEASIGAHIVNNLGAFIYAMFSSSVAAARGVSSITWDKAAWDILTFVLFALVAWWLGRKMNVATLTP